MSEKIYPDNVDKIKDFVTRPRNLVYDLSGSGRGRFTISPLAFPNVNFSGNENPTRITPSFKITYKDAKFYVGYDYFEDSEIGIIRRNLVQSATNTTVVLDINASGVLDAYKFYTIKIVEGAGKGQNRNIVSYNGGTKEATIDLAWTTNPDSTSTFLILLRQNTATGSANPNSITLDADASTDNGFYDSYLVTSGDEVQLVSRFIRIIDGTGKGQVRFIVADPPGPAYDGTTKELFVTEDWTTQPDNTSVFVILETHAYKWDGTENDNKEGVYEVDGNPIIDPVTGEPVDHFRKGYSAEEVTNYLRRSLEPTLNMGKDGGTLLNWIFATDSINVGGGGSKSVFIDPFGINSNASIPRTGGPVNTRDNSALIQKRAQLARHRRFTKWLITNDIDDVLVAENKSPFLKDYPNVYNSEYLDTLSGTAQAGAVNSITLDQSAKSESDYYNDATITIVAGTASGESNTISDYDGLTKVATVLNNWAVTPDNTSEYEITNVIKEGGHISTGVDADGYRIQVNTSTTPDLRPFTPDMIFYMKENSYHNNITLDLSNDSMFGRHHISILHKLYHTNTGTNDTIITELEDLYNNGVAVPGTDPHIIRKTSYVLDDNNDLVIDRNVTKYFYKRRGKNTVTDLVPSPTVPSATELQYTDSGANEVTIHLIPGTNDLNYILSNPSKTSTDIRQDIMENNELIPGVILPTDPEDSLEAIFVTNDTIDVLDPFYEQEKARSKKTFIHLPTNGIQDGYCLELDVSLPKELDTPTFTENTLGVLSGYKNYITQPRVYVFSGYQIKAGENCNLDVGLTEKDNPYLFSPIPELEHSINGNDAYSANIFHQRTMTVDDIYGNKFIRKITFSPTSYTDAIESDIGKVVIGSDSGDTGRLVNYDNDNLTWIVKVFTDSPTFNDSEIITIEDGTGTGTGIGQAPLELDKRNLLAVIYPTTTNTFSWRLDKNPKFKLMYWSIMANTEYKDSASYVAYKRNRDAVLDFTDLFDMGLDTFSLSYKNDFCNCQEYTHYISGHSRLFLPSSIVPSFDGEQLSSVEANYASLVYQGNKSYNNLISDFYKGRMRLDLRSDMGDLDTELQYIGFNNSSIVGVPTGYFNGYFVYDEIDIPSPAGPNAQRWMTKPNDLPEYIVYATDTTQLFKDPFQTADDYRIYLQNFFTRPPRESDASSIYIPGTLYQNDAPTYEYGQGISNILTDYLLNNHPEEFTRTDDFRRTLWESSFDIPFFSENHPGYRRKYDYFEFTAEAPNSIEYNGAWYGMVFSPFTNLFSFNGINIEEHSIDTIEDLATIESIGYESARSTLLELLRGNPISEKYYRLNSGGDAQELNMSKMVGIHDHFDSVPDTSINFINTHTNEFIKNFITTYSNHFTKRFYNSYRIILTGVDTATEHDSNGLVENYDTQRTYQSNVFSYFTNIIDEITDRPRSTDDDYILKDESLGSFTKAEDFDYSWTFFDKGHGYRGLSSVTTAQVGSANTITLDALASLEDDFYTDNLITIVSGTGSGQTRTITAYDGTTKIATVDSNWVVTPDNTSVFQIKTHLKNLLTANGQQYTFKKAFYDSKGEDGYIRIRMKFIFSEKLGRWVTLEYRQTPMTYLTPTFGDTALSYKEKSTVLPNKAGNAISDYVPIQIPETVNEQTAFIDSQNRNIVTFTDTTGLFSSVFEKNVNVITYDKDSNGFLNPSRYSIAKINSVQLTHQVETQEWDPTVSYNTGDYVKSEGIVYQVVSGPVGPSYTKPKYETFAYTMKEPVINYAPNWDVNRTFTTGMYVTHGNAIYVCIQTITGGLSPNLNGFNYILLEDYSISAAPWNPAITYNAGQLVSYDGIIYEVVVFQTTGVVPPPPVNLDYKPYKKIRPYAVDWNSTESFAINTYVFYSNIFYKAITATTIGVLPDINTSLSEISVMYIGDSPGGIYDYYKLFLNNSVSLVQGFETFLSTYVNSIENDTYPINPSNASTNTDFLWKHAEGNCFPSPLNVPYYRLKPMELNRFCIPFLSKKLPYSDNGILYDFIERWKTHDDDFNVLIDSVPTFEDYTLGSSPEFPEIVLSIHDVATGNAEATWSSTISNNGLSRRDHTTGVYTQIPNYSTLAGAGVSNRATSIDSDSLGNVYFSSGVIVRYDGSTYSRFIHASAPNASGRIYIDRINDICYSVGNDGFFVSSSGFSTANPTTMTWTRYYSGNTPILPNSTFIDVHKGPDGTVWFIALDGTNKIFKFDGVSVTFENISFMGINHTQKNSIRVAPNGDVFASGYSEFDSSSKISRRDYATGTWIVFNQQAGLRTPLPGQIRIDSTGTVFIGTSNGLCKYLYDGQVEIIGNEQGLYFPNDDLYQNAFFYSLDIDSTNNVWCGGYGGLLYYRRFTFVNYADYIPYKLKEPQRDPFDIVLPGIDFVVPNNVHGGKFSSANRDLYLFHPHMFRVYWHIRPVVSAYTGTDIPSPTDRTGGTISDPCLSNMFNFPNLKGDQEFIVPWHKDMNKNWLLNGEEPEFVISENNDPEDIITDDEDSENIIDENI